MERTHRNRQPFVTVFAVVVTALTTLILAAPYAGEFTGGGPGHASGGAATVAPCVPSEAAPTSPATAATYPPAPPAVAPTQPPQGPGWATEEKLGGP